MIENEISGVIVDVAYKVHTTLGPGLLDKVIVELKSVENLHPVHKKQLLTYLRLADKKVGLLINFNVPLIKDGITRIVNKL
jgi:hypothetical protein